MRRLFILLVSTIVIIDKYALINISLAILNIQMLLELV